MGKPHRPGAGHFQECEIDGPANDKFEQGKDAFRSRNYDKAIRIFVSLARKGHAGPAYAMGEIRRLGLGCAKDMDSAKDWYARAAKLGSAWASFRLGWILYEESGLNLNGDKILKNSVGYLVVAAEAGIEPAQYLLGLILASNIQSGKDAIEARSWIRMFASRNIREVSKILGDLESNMTFRQIRESDKIMESRQFNSNKTPEFVIYV